MKTEDLIQQLSSSLQVIKPISRLRLSLELLAIIFANFTVMTIVMGVPDVFSSKIGDLLFVAELGLNLLLVVVAANAAVAFAYPECPGSQTLTPVLLIAFVGYSALALFSAFSDPNLIIAVADSASHGLECLACILIFAAIPTAWMVWRLGKLASTAPAILGGLILLTATATGCLGVRIVEAEIINVGLIVWHYLPLILLSGIGAVAGAKIFRW